MQDNKGRGGDFVANVRSSSPIADLRDQLNEKPFCTQTKYKYEEKLQKKLQKAEQNRADCQQAFIKAQNRSDELNRLGGNKLLMILDEAITSRPKNQTSNGSFCLKVVDYAKEGIIVENNCTPSPVANMFSKYRLPNGENVLQF